jgi:hypothetical protein
MRWRAALVAATTLAGVAAGAAPAQAHGPCSGEYKVYGLCLYYNSNNQGARVSASGPVYNYNNAFEGPIPRALAFSLEGNGGGQPVKNNTASVYNLDLTPYTVYYNSGWAGPADSFPYEGYGGSELWFGNLNHTYNENASQYDN